MRHTSLQTSMVRSLVLTLLAALALAAGALAHPLDPTDTDHDGLKNPNDNCPENYNPKQQDTDKDAVPIATTPQQDVPQVGQTGGPVYNWTEAKGYPTDRPTGVGGDACDEDDDDDGITDKPRRDNCARIANKDQADNDSDGQGDPCDPDDDNDDLFDVEDPCPLQPVCGGGPASAATVPDDGKAPTVTVTAGKRYRLEQLGMGVPVYVKVSKGAAVTGELKSGSRALGRGTAKLGRGGATYVFVRLSGTGTKRVRKARAVKAKLMVTATDAAGRRTTVVRTLTLRSR